MPDNGGNPLARFAHAIADQRGFSFASPHVSDDGTTVLVPILRSHPRSRNYVLPAEAPENLSAIDMGRLDRLRVRNDGNARALLPPGTLFEGHGTPSRATAVGTVLEPGTTTDLPVMCVHATQPVAAGVPLTASAWLAPDRVTEALLTGDQGRVWAAVDAAVAAETRRGRASRPSAPGITDLLEAIASPRPSLAASDDTECGRIVLDQDGVTQVEVFDHPHSWKAMSRRAPPGGFESDPPRRLSLRVDGAIQLARGFLRALSEKSYRSDSVHAWAANDATASYTVVDGEVIHLLAFGRRFEAAEFTADNVGTGAASPGTVSAGADAPVPLAGDGPVEHGGAEAGVVAEPRGSEGLDSEIPPTRPLRRKILTSGWDAGTLGSLERYAAKECGGDRSAAIRFLVRKELRTRGYMGPRPLPLPSDAGAPSDSETIRPPIGARGATLEVRVHDFERIVQTEAYAPWLRERARSELKRMSAAADEFVRAEAQSALERLPLEPPAQEEELPGPAEEEIPPAPALPPPLPPLDVRPLLRRAFAASAGGQYPEALTLFDEVLLAEPDNRTALLGRAVAMRRSGKTQEALDALGLVLEKEPANAAALLNRGRILQERGDFEGALESFDALARVASNDWDVWMVRGDVLARMGRDREARDAYDEALRRNPDDAELLAKIRALDKMQPAPAPTPLQRMPLPRGVQEGQSYLVKERRPDISLRVLRALLLRTVPALLITTLSAEAVRRESGLAGIRTLELTHAPGEGRHDPTALAALTNVLDRFVRENHLRGVIVLEGLGSLIRENGFRETALFIERVHETILQSHALFLVSVTPGDLEDRELALLGRSLIILS